MVKINISDSRYPERLKKITDPPENLYYKGDWDQNLFENCLAVVGSRKMTKYGEKICTNLVSQVAARGITIVSGFMYGIDAMAHRAAVRVGGKTIAVMPCGIEKIHPAYQKKLYKEILKKNGLIVSEWADYQSAAKWTYPKRNRIVAGLSQAVLIVQAAEKSGSLITARLAEKFKRKLFAVPGPLTSSVSIGTANLIKEGKAEIVTDAKDIVKVFQKKQYKIKLQESQNANLADQNSLEKRITNTLKVEPLSIDELARKLKISVNILGSTLSEMQIKGFLEEESGKYYLSDNCY